MDIRTIMDVKAVAGQMHDSEFMEGDFSFDNQQKIFHLVSHSPENLAKTYDLKFYNVGKYTPINLGKIKAGKATGGVFNTIKIHNNGLDLTLISQDLQIEISLSKLEGVFELKEK